MQVMHDDYNNITICTALYQSSGFFIIMSPAEGLHFSALGLFVCLFVCLSQVYLLTWMPQHCVYSMDSLHTTIS